MKKSLLMSVSILMIFVLAVSVAQASEIVGPSVQKNDQGPFVQVFDVQSFPDPNKGENKSAAKEEKDPLYDGLIDSDGKINDVNPEKLKQALLKRWSKDPVRYKDSIENIDTITANFAAQLNAEKVNQQKNLSAGSTDIQLLSAPLCCYVTATWATGHPYIYQTMNAVYWGVKIPAWTAWAYRPFIRTKEEYWQGTMRYEYWSIPNGAWTWTSEHLEGVNVSLTNKGNEYWSAVNGTNSTTATTPSPPTTPPW